VRLALYQPEIPQNTGTLLRLGACLGVPVDIIEPCSFVWHDQKLRRAGMDYLELANVTRHVSWFQFQQVCEQKAQRLILLDVQGETSFLDFQFSCQDVLMVGRESLGVPVEVFDQIPHRIKIPMLKQRRSLNLAVAASIVLSEALRQTNLFPGDDE
jgi:tRNA (cytidine/uridine-2'-O-)-methyltransferase